MGPLEKQFQHWLAYIEADGSPLCDHEATLMARAIFFAGATSVLSVLVNRDDTLTALREMAKEINTCCFEKETSSVQ
jgi:hypothetical protein